MVRSKDTESQIIHIIYIRKSTYSTLLVFATVIQTTTRVTLTQTSRVLPHIKDSLKVV